ncbi:hypothetical protein Tco_0396593 [Tanacetum coccineum]
MLTAPESSPSRITSSPSLSPQTHPSTSRPQTTFVAEEPALMPHESPLQSVHSLGRDEGSLTLNELTVLCTTLSKKVEDLQIGLQQTKKVYSYALTKLILRVKKLEKQVKTSKARRREDAEIQEKISDDTEVLLEEEEPTEIVEDQGSGEKGKKEVSTVGAKHSIVIPKVSTAAENLVYIRRSDEKKNDKGKGIMTVPKPEKMTKNQLEQERLGHEEVVRLQEQLNKEETQRIARDAKIAKQLQEEYDRARQEQEVVAKDDQAHVIDWSDLAVIRYHAQQNKPYSVAEVRKNMCIYLKNQGGFKMSHFKGMNYDDIRPIFERVWDQNQSFVPMDSEKEKGSEKKRSRNKALDRKRVTEKQNLKILFQPDEEDEVWRHQHEYNLISWRLFDSCGIHILLMDNGIAIHMMIEKKYPLTQEMLSKMLKQKQS